MPSPMPAEMQLNFFSTALNMCSEYLRSLLICLLCAGTLSNDGVANTFFLDKQKFIFEILQRVQEPFMNEQVIRSGCTLVLERAEYTSINAAMKRFYDIQIEGGLLPSSTHFTPFDPLHLQEALGLFYYFYHVLDWQALRMNICWARLHVNPGVFVFALTQALLKREDYRGLILPKIYEMLPEHFYDAALVHQAQRFNYATWSRYGPLFNERHSLQTFACSPQPVSNELLRNTSAWHRAMNDVRFLCLQPAAPKPGNDLLSDVQWHAHWYYLNMGVMLVSVESEVDVQTLREWWYWNLQQLLARYRLELEANSVCSQRPAVMLPLLSWTGMSMQALPLSESHKLEQRFRQLIALVQKATNEESIILPDGSWQSMTTIEDGNWQRLLQAHFDFDVLKLFASPSMRMPGYMRNLETMLHEPEFYTYAGMLVQAQQQLKSQFKPYQLQHLLAPSLQFNAVTVGPLLTYYAPMDMDISNLLNNRHFYYEDIFVWQKSLQVRQQRLQHEPFQLTFNITTAQAQPVIVRSFLVNNCHSNGSPCSYFQLDTFVTSLAAGYNIIERQSRDFFGTVRQQLSYTELYRYNLLALEEQFEFPLNLSTANCALPNRLLLPRGQLKGLAMRMVFVATPYTYQLHMGRNLECNHGSGITHFDDLPFGFPFDRAWALNGNERTKLGSDLSKYSGLPNIHWQDVKIYHSNKVT